MRHRGSKNSISGAKGPSPVVRESARRADWIYVDDVVDAYAALREAPGIEGRTVEIGSGKLVSIREIVGEVAHLVGAGIAPTSGHSPTGRWNPWELPMWRKRASGSDGPRKHR